MTAEEVDLVSGAAGYLGRDTDHWTAAIDSEDPIERRLAAYALGEIGVADPAAVAALRTRLSDPISFVRAWAAASLARLEPGADDALATLEAAASDELDFVRSLAAWLLGRVAQPDQVEDGRRIVTPLLDDPAQSVRAEASRALDRLERLQRGVAAS